MKNSLKLDVNAMVERYSLPTRLKAELAVVCAAQVSEVLSRTRVSPKVTSYKTQERRMYTVCRTFAELRTLGFAVESAHALSAKHLTALVAYWIGEGQSGGTIENKLSHLRAYAKWIGKRGLVLSLEDYVDREAAGLKRTYVTTTDKSWEAAGVDAGSLISEIGKQYPRVAVQLKLQAAFGLRIEESFSLKPASALRNLDTLRVKDGTKGGRERLVPTQLRLDVLAEALALCDPLSGSTTPATYTIARWRDHYNFVLRKFGIYKKGLGVTSHGLRHQWLQEYYERISGAPAPVKGSVLRPDADLHREALQLAVEAAGHSKASKTGAYLSTHHTMAGIQRKRISPDEAKQALDQANGNVSQAAKHLGVTRQSLYRAMAHLAPR
ncbi:integrase [Robbsia andropogonis]|uniref:phage integrase N-terminal domain-containing protein n=1 Tax=Robbsia andropogonis TaxID=28092 RepID=UPI003D22C4BD